MDSVPWDDAAFNEASAMMAFIDVETESMDAAIEKLRRQADPLVARHHPHGRALDKG
ncbi:MAG: hypothetical protein LBU32_03740 [Clostridiales bacterium]|jgi:hypothetical protein|nr:hypothetical protein [Clostridiales bacterium]